MPGPALEPCGSGEARSERLRAIRDAPPAPSRAARLSTASLFVAGDTRRSNRLFLEIPSTSFVDDVRAPRLAEHAVVVFVPDRRAVHRAALHRVVAGSAA